MRDVIEVLVAWTVTNAVTLAFLRWDERHLPLEEREHAWPDVSRLSAVVGIALGVSPLHLFVVLPVHFWRTRRGLGLFPRVTVTLAGVGVALAFIVLGVIAVLVVDATPNLPFPDRGDAQLYAATAVEFTLLYVAYRILRRLSRVDPGGGRRTT